MNNDKDVLAAENERLGKEHAKMLKSFGQMKNSNKLVISKLTSIRSSAQELKITRTKLSEDVKKFFSEFKADLKAQFSQPVMFKLKVDIPLYVYVCIEF